MRDEEEGVEDRGIPDGVVQTLRRVADSLEDGLRRGWTGGGVLWTCDGRTDEEADRAAKAFVGWARTYMCATSISPGVAETIRRAAGYVAHGLSMGAIGGGTVWVCEGRWHSKEEANQAAKDFVHWTTERLGPPLASIYA